MTTTLAKQKVSILTKNKNHSSFKLEPRSVSDIIRKPSGVYGIATVKGRKVAVTQNPDGTWFVLGCASKFTRIWGK